MMGVFDSIELRMLRRADYVRQRKHLRDSHVRSHETQSVHKFEREIGRALLSIHNSMESKHSSYVNIRVFLKFHLATLLRRADYMRCLKLLTG